MVAVLGLACLTASPQLHAWLHDTVEQGCSHQHGDNERNTPEAPVGSLEHTCAITLFASGVLPLLICEPPPAPTVAHTAAPAIGEERNAAAHPRYWLIPSHAPPAV